LFVLGISILKQICFLWVKILKQKGFLWVKNQIVCFGGLNLKTKIKYKSLSVLGVMLLE
jgi:hypothetical protein